MGKPRKKRARGPSSKTRTSPTPRRKTTAGRPRKPRKAAPRRPRTAVSSWGRFSVLALDSSQGDPELVLGHVVARSAREAEGLFRNEAEETLGMDLDEVVFLGVFRGFLNKPPRTPEAVAATVVLIERL